MGQKPEHPMNWRFLMNTDKKSTLDRKDKAYGEDHMREKQIESKLVKAVKAAGGICPKLVSPGMDGMPDRMALMPGGRIGFVEVKAPGKSPRPLQTNRHRMLRQLGFQVFVLDDTEQIPGIIEKVTQ